jgi:hypothetical protein
MTGSGSEGAQTNLQESYSDSFTLEEAETLAVSTLKQVCFHVRMLHSRRGRPDFLICADLAVLIVTASGDGGEDQQRLHRGGISHGARLQVLRQGRPGGHPRPHLGLGGPLPADTQGQVRVGVRFGRVIANRVWVARV